MKKNNTAEKAVLDAEKITKALKEGTEKSLRDIMNEAISKLVMDGEEVGEPEEVEDDSYEVEDVDTEETPVEADDASAEDAGEEIADVEGAEGEDAAEDAEDEWSDMEQYKVGDNDYDFTGVDGDEVLKVYNKMGDDDKLLVTKEDDGTYSVKDDETGAEFVIELNPDAEGEEAEADADVEDGSDEGSFESDFDEPEDSDEEITLDFDNDEEGDDDEMIDIDIDGDEDELNEENLGYTDSYQKDVFSKKFNMNEPADSKATYQMDAGAPKGAEKPWAGKGDSKPFDNKVDECNNECTANLEEDGQGLNTKHSMKKSTNRINKGANNQRVVSEPENGYVGTKINESVAKIVAKAKEIQAENKQYKECIDKIKGSLYEAAVLNVNLGKLVDILVNETTTKDEKKRICERFNNVKTIAEGKTLYSTIKSELKESRNTMPTVEKQFVAESKQLNETTIYQNVNDPSIDLMNRMDNLFKKK